jgi:nitroreductase
MKASAEIFNQIVNERRSVRVYDAEVPFDTDAVTRSIDRAILSPNSSNMQLWEFYRVRDPKKIAAIAAFCFNQPAARTATELVIVVTRLDHWKEHAKHNVDHLKKQFKEPYGKKEEMALSYYQKVMPLLYSHDTMNILGFFKKIVATVKGISGLTYWQVGYADLRTIVHKSAALASQTIMLSLKSEGYDSCPMEGFDSRKVKKYLGLPGGAEINMIISTGTAKPEGIYGERFRLDRSEVVFEV